MPQAIFKSDRGIFGGFSADVTSVTIGAHANMLVQRCEFNFAAPARFMYNLNNMQPFVVVGRPIGEGVLVRLLGTAVPSLDFDTYGNACNTQNSIQVTYNGGCSNKLGEIKITLRGIIFESVSAAVQVEQYFLINQINLRFTRLDID
ncbi:MAG: hypothetical protein QXH92_04140 [Candidatus Aenigmatarchaeota archaeon]